MKTVCSPLADHCDFTLAINIQLVQKSIAGLQKETERDGPVRQAKRVLKFNLNVVLE